jgi:hypothetical protein
MWERDLLHEGPCFHQSEDIHSCLSLPLPQTTATSRTATPHASLSNNQVPISLATPLELACIHKDLVVDGHCLLLLPGAATSDL